MDMCQDLTGDNTKRIDEIIEKYLAMINNMRSFQLARKMVWKGFIGF